MVTALIMNQEILKRKISMSFPIPDHVDKSVAVFVLVLCAEGQSSHQDVCDEAHGWYVEVGSVHIKAWSHRSVLLVAHLPVLRHTHKNTLYLILQL